MVGAIEFLRKEKAICKSIKKCDEDCPLAAYCGNTFAIEEADMVRMVMDYQIKENKDA